MAGISEAAAESAMRQGMGYAKHLGVPSGTDRWRKIVYGTKRAKGWRPSKRRKASLSHAAMKRS